MRSKLLARVIGALLLACLAVTATAAPSGRGNKSNSQETVGPDGSLMVWVPPGTFMMGSDDSNTDKPAHQVQITRGFWIGKCEVTNSQYRRYCQAKGLKLPVQYGNLEDNAPVDNLPWEAAWLYCQYFRMQLPTEAQWEYAARGPDSWLYPWGDEWDPGRCCHAAKRGPSGTTWPVASFPSGASWCGALDLAGNVQEWCNDEFDRSYYENSPVADPPGPTPKRSSAPVTIPSGMGGMGGNVRDETISHVIRGGYWRNDYPFFFLCARHAGTFGSSGGFRCVVVP